MCGDEMNYDIIIIGAGPAGLTAGIYAARSLKKVLVLEKNSYGGQIINSVNVENYPGYEHINGFDLATNLYNQALNLGVEIKYEEVVDIRNKKTKEVITTKNKYYTKTIILANGCKNRLLGIEREKELIGRGISYCATCDGNFYRGKDVAVVGGGNTAISDALYLSDIVNKVYIIHRREEFRASDKDLSLLKKKKNVEFVLNSNIAKLIGDNNLEGIEIRNNKNEKNIINVQGLFIAIGQEPMNECFKPLIKTDNSGYVVSKENCHTNLRGIFVAGDIRKKELRQLVTAASDGAIAAMEACKYLKNN